MEPLPELIEYSKEKCLELLPDVTCIFENVALSDYIGHGEMLIPLDHNLGVSKLAGRAAPTSTTIRVDTFENMMSRHPTFKPDLIKIDAEGSDITILFSMIEWLKLIPNYARPLIVFEISIKAEGELTIPVLRELYHDLEYILVDFDPSDDSKDLWLFPRWVRHDIC